MSFYGGELPLTGGAINGHIAVGVGSVVDASNVINVSETLGTTIRSLASDISCNASSGVVSLTGSSITTHNQSTGTAVVSHTGLSVIPRHETAVNGHTLTGLSTNLTSSVGGTGTLASTETASIGSPSWLGAAPTTHYGISINNQGAAGVGTSYGLHLAAQSGSTNNWSLASSGGNSFLVGNTRFGASTAPTNPISVTGQADISGHTAIGGAVQSNALLYVTEVLDANSDIGLYGNFSFSGTANNSTSYGGLVQLFNTAGFTGHNISGLTGRAEETSGSGSVTKLVGVGAEVGIDEPAGGAVTDVYGVQASVSSSFYRATRASGLRVENMGALGTTVMGLWLAAQTGATTNWAIASDGGSSYHTGNFGFGASTAPTSTVQVTGTLSASSSVKFGSTAVFGGDAVNIKETFAGSASGVTVDVTSQTDEDPGQSLSGVNITARGTTGVFGMDLVGLDVTARHQNATSGSTLVGARLRWLSANGATGVLTSGTGLVIDTPSMVGATTGDKPTTTTGIQIENQSSSGTTTNYGLRILAQSGATTNWQLANETGNSYFAGNTRFGGTTAPTVALDVTGAGKISTFLNVGSTNDAAATGDFSAGAGASNRIFYDQSINVLSMLGPTLDSSTLIDLTGTGPSIIIYDTSLGTPSHSLSFASPGVVFNETGVSTVDFRIEGDTDANLFFLDSSADVIGIGTSTPDVDCKLDINGGYCSRVSGFTAVNGNNNNIAIGDFSIIRITGPTAAFTITGIANVANGKSCVLYNATTQIMTVSNEDANSTAANRIHTMDGANIVTVGEGNVTLFYDPTGARWIPTAFSL